MLYPKIADLMEGLESRYSLCVMTAKRARQIAAETAEDKAVSKAVQEIAAGKVKCHSPYENDAETERTVSSDDSFEE